MHRFALAATVGCMAGVLTGAMVTSSGGTEYAQLHQITAAATAIIVAILGVWIFSARKATLGRLGLAILEAS